MHYDQNLYQQISNLIFQISKIKKNVLFQLKRPHDQRICVKSSK